MKDKCESCRFYESKSSTSGECRRYAPRPGDKPVWPVVMETWGCGEHEEPNRESWGKA